uniref:Prefoldin subunit 5 n=1 Tax=Haptolina ericina TaxID=156174 RepID=A0A7S3BER8_9EUKA|mmetsp:Transcript_57208/g.127719  ORF Transcript_57208/g.127719 Transcript_57208/m.127719 type:complete len:146 (+) Transcript_57208:63-500(+)|eukprot:CAMPEP_0181178030 /NCGR_PEP_ID=MMETSP1096-20121128/5498_1 /TAXON_ID=156174 ORGANISM="Chrysochromulina ericina, Strain CCMP281" /NCGR_SAMPLE_ID=MMETSP1096 /ASSEMBLY_ACC=CAM_ASM_000453 /LENGTH=145 /DNA_ID=CAMNT_0023266263 /DNA_START=63 /DNA_END=500 /DNA_ORIENTATION=+
MGDQGINLMALSLNQLAQLKQSIEEEMQGLSGALQQLQVSKNKLIISKASLEKVTKTPEGTPMLVPVTGSMYVRGETAQMQTLLVDVGTGYLIEKSPDEAQNFLSRKIQLIDDQAGNVQKTASIKQSQLQDTVNVMNQKVISGGA